MNFILSSFFSKLLSIDSNCRCMCGLIFTADGRIGGGLPVAVCINIHAALAPPVKKAEKSCTNSFHKTASKHKYSNVQQF